MFEHLAHAYTSIYWSSLSLNTTYRDWKLKHHNSKARLIFFRRFSLSFPSFIILSHCVKNPRTRMKASRITSPFCRFLFLSTIFVVVNPIIASPALSPRQESIWELPSSQQIIDSLEAGWGIIDRFFDGFTLPELPQQPERGLTEGSTKTGGLVQPQPLLTNDECSQQPVGAPDNQCIVGTSRIIFSRDCGNDAQNAEIGQLLIKIVYSGSVSTITDDDCGVIFWAGDFTEESVDTIRKTNGVLGVEPDVPLYDTSNKDLREVRAKKKRSGESESHTSKRDTLIVQRPPVSKDLSFVSDPPNHIGDGYAYYSAAGEGINVYVIETGADARNKDFSSGVIKRWIYTSSVPRTEPEVDWEGHGTCVASKVAGLEYGVAKKASLIMVKIARVCHSLLEALVSVLNDLRRRRKAGENIAGYNVITIQHGTGPGRKVSKLTTALMKMLISAIMEKYAVVIVCAAGNDAREVDSLPSLFSPMLPLIVVGGVDPDTGDRTMDSNFGPAVTVSAPAEVVCASPWDGSGWAKQGTSFAASAVAGLVAYFLSSQDVGPMLRKKPGLIVQAVKQYIMDSAYIRLDGTDKAIWNQTPAQPWHIPLA